MHSSEMSKCHDQERLKYNVNHHKHEADVLQEDIQTGIRGSRGRSPQTTAGEREASDIPALQSIRQSRGNEQS